MPYQKIRVVAFDADDTLWVNEPVYQKIERELVDLLSHHIAPHIARKKFNAKNINNLELFGYGVKGFMLSMIETAIEISQGKVTGTEIQQIISMGKKMLRNPVELLDGVEEVLRQLQGRYVLMLITKGDLVDQENKIARSGLTSYFSHIEILSEKNENSYEKLFYKYQFPKNEFLMVGNSIKFDVLPVVNIGGKAVHIPFHTTWDHEHIDERHLENKQFMELKNAKELLPLLITRAI